MVEASNEETRATNEHNERETMSNNEGRKLSSDAGFAFNDDILEQPQEFIYSGWVKSRSFAEGVVNFTNSGVYLGVKKCILE